MIAAAAFVACMYGVTYSIALHNCAKNCHFPPQPPVSRHLTPAKFGTGFALTLLGGANNPLLSPRMIPRFLRSLETLP
jgi:hypothetical protein